MKKILVLALLLAMSASTAFAATDSKNLNIGATVNSKAKLSLGLASISFADADPDLVSSIAASEGAVSVTSKVRTGAASVSTLKVLTSGDLVDGSKSIPINAVSWTASGAGYSNGALSASTEQTVGSFTGSGIYNGDLAFSMANSWLYEPGSYAASADFTLTSP